MADSIATHVCTVVARVLNVPPQNIRPESQLFAGSFGMGRLLALSYVLEGHFDLVLPQDAALGWTTVTDVILAIEKAILAERDRVGAARGAAA